MAEQELVFFIGGRVDLGEHISDDEGLFNTWPRFLPHYLPQDLGDQFTNCPRFLFSHYSAADGRHDTIQSVELAHAFGHDSR